MNTSKMCPTEHLIEILKEMRTVLTQDIAWIESIFDKRIVTAKKIIEDSKKIINEIKSNDNRLKKSKSTLYNFFEIDQIQNDQRVCEKIGNIGTEFLWIFAMMSTVCDQSKFDKEQLDKNLNWCAQKFIQNERVINEKIMPYQHCKRKITDYIQCFNKNFENELKKDLEWMVVLFDKNISSKDEFFNHWMKDLIIKINTLKQNIFKSKEQELEQEQKQEEHKQEQEQTHEQEQEQEQTQKQTQIKETNEIDNTLDMQNSMTENISQEQIDSMDYSLRQCVLEELDFCAEFMNDNLKQMTNEKKKWMEKKQEHDLRCGQITYKIHYLQESLRLACVLL